LTKLISSAQCINNAFPIQSEQTSSIFIEYYCGVMKVVPLAGLTPGVIFPTFTPINYDLKQSDGVSSPLNISINP